MSKNKRRRTARPDAATVVAGSAQGDAINDGARRARHATADTGQPPGTDFLPMWLRVLDVVVRVVDMALRLL
ncbi:hypothetical protein ACFXAE_05665 [Streptomyces sp. NPDC059454]|jgi:hypothetical protein|uniref:hypothetical protein n=1 Tax=Streptomyces sp. NPDC059454 TaxID=3346836 RepID=UPI00367F71E5